MCAGLPAASAAWWLATGAVAQVNPPPQRDVDWRADSGPVRAVASSRGDTGPSVVYTTTVFVPRAPWLRLRFEAVDLSGRLDQGTGAYLRLTSLADGGQQRLDAVSAAQWAGTSAYFNGDAVRVELLAYPGQGDSRVAVRAVTAGMDDPGGGTDSICGPNDDRLLSFDNRLARHSYGCTAWMIDDTNHQFLTAGHCGALEGDVMSFNVPLSTAEGTIVAAAPQDQYAVDGSSTQGNNGGTGIGDDWCYFGVYPNSDTGLMPSQAYGAWFTLQNPAPSYVPGQTVRVTGYGTTTGTQGTPRTWSQTQTTDVGPRALPTLGTIATAVAYVTDTTGGNSGSPVTLESDGGVAVAIHTHGVCTSTGGANYGTASQHPGLQSALASPHGVCASGDALPTGSLFVAGDAVNNLGTLNTSTGQFGKVAVCPARMEGLTYSWNSRVFYGVSNDTYGIAPGGAGVKLWSIDPATGAATYLATVSGAGGVVNGLGYDPGSNVLYGIVSATGALVAIDTVTGAARAAGVPNGGSITGLEFDPFNGTLYGIDDGSGASKLVWFTPGAGVRVVVGPLGAGISNCNGLAVTDDGSLWTINAGTGELLRIDAATGAAIVVGPTGGMFGSSYGMAAVLTRPAVSCYANCDGSTMAPLLTVNDFVCFLNRFAAGDSYANCDGSSQPPLLNINDFLCFQAAFAQGCP
jgi:V8-like Glu-specific endopeptidase